MWCHIPGVFFGENSLTGDLAPCNVQLFHGNEHYKADQGKCGRLTPGFCSERSLVSLAPSTPSPSGILPSAALPTGYHASTSATDRKSLKGWPSYILSISTPLYCGSLLLIAASLKAKDHFGELGNVRNWFDRTQIATEIIVGLSLLLGYYPRIFRWIAFGLYFIFMVIAAYHEFTGSKTCGCFGRMSIAPWIPAILDFTACVSLWNWHPSISRLPLRLLAFATATTVLGAIALSNQYGANKPGHPLLPIPETVDLGSIHKGQIVHSAIHLYNTLNSPTTVDSVEASCPCFIAASQRFQVLGEQEIDLPFDLDLARESGFTGSLAVRVRGRTESGADAFLCQILVTVTP